MTDPELQGPDATWQAIRRGHGHVYIVLALIVLLAVWDAPIAPRTCAMIAGLAAGVFADLWAHQYQH